MTIFGYDRFVTPESGKFFANIFAVTNKKRNKKILRNNFPEDRLCTRTNKIF